MPRSDRTDRTDPAPVAAVEPDRLVAAAHRYEAHAAGLRAAAGALPAPVPDAGFTAAVAAAELDADLVARVRDLAGRFADAAAALRSCAAAWSGTDAAAARALGDRADGGG